MKDTDERSTPQELFDYANEAYGPFDLDVCATPANAKCDAYYSRELKNGLLVPWYGRVWCNPPYSRGNQIKWVARALEQITISGGAELVCLLLPVDTSTKLWHQYIWDSARRTWRPWVWRAEFLEGRVKFNGSKTAAKFGSALVVFRDPK